MPWNVGKEGRPGGDEMRTLDDIIFDFAMCLFNLEIDGVVQSFAYDAVGCCGKGFWLSA